METVPKHGPNGAPAIGGSKRSSSGVGVKDAPLVPAATSSTTSSGALDEVQLDIIDICVRATQVVGLPRSIGEIFGLILGSSKPVSFDDVVRHLGISSGSASHGLRKMCRLGIIKTCYIPRDRRDHYTFETSFRTIALALLEESVLVHICWADERIERLRAKTRANAATRGALAEKVDILAEWNNQARTAMKRALETLK